MDLFDGADSARDGFLAGPFDNGDEPAGPVAQYTLDNPVEDEAGLMTQDLVRGVDTPQEFGPGTVGHNEAVDAENRCLSIGHVRPHI